MIREVNLMIRSEISDGNDINAQLKTFPVNPKCQKFLLNHFQLSFKPSNTPAIGAATSFRLQFIALSIYLSILLYLFQKNENIFNRKNEVLEIELWLAGLIQKYIKKVQRWQMILIKPTISFNRFLSNFISFIIQNLKQEGKYKLKNHLRQLQSFNKAKNQQKKKNKRVKCKSFCKAINDIDPYKIFIGQTGNTQESGAIVFKESFNPVKKKNSFQYPYPQVASCPSLTQQFSLKPLSR
ncbi:hypothetical protein TTHERM_01092410 (macronuclear) [Tetrahymena thermophila SB210]|uniref:Uncharacterized protein n=1 Tax=Tetrahymena thermophila (strain SB210) TaxID=312017 RepID=Q24BP0_TETTS|nr:hypothetical protein TTHERM_01092410 [Tetrahymena thermophila SB210]EAS05203.2 hypothetical protein TTHERM_01092410 [Tetrahymena thermophila SB210]|eukprot:XP_001025448.2 hypothetical protein TTHERM_01092410 [Tetrahymena thermophila SB210]